MAPNFDVEHVVMDTRESTGNPSGILRSLSAAPLLHVHALYTAALLAKRVGHSGGAA